jgi:polynucleotide 5'-hydroxyl-kinase GRC3/NOL9
VRCIPRNQPHRPNHAQGPPFTHPTLPIAAHYIGTTTPRTSPAQYLEAIHALVQTYRQDLQTPILNDDDDHTRFADARNGDVIPLVMNTTGWTKGLGADLRQKTAETLDATDIFELESNPHDLAAGTALVHRLEAIAPSVLSQKYSAADMRTLSILSYFHAVFPAPLQAFTQVTAIAWDTSTPLCAQAPYAVDCRIALDRVALVGPGTEDVVRTDITCVLNGALVALVECDASMLDAAPVRDENDKGALPYIQSGSPPSPAESTCHGLALIRSLAPGDLQLHVLTPLPPHILARCRALVMGPLELPVWGMLDFAGQVPGRVQDGRAPFLRDSKGVENR